MKGRLGILLGRVPAWQDGTPGDVDEPDAANPTEENPIIIDPRFKAADSGIEVIEDQAGTAHGQWVLHVRCECGRRWFELEAISASTCPECGLLVYVEIEKPNGMM